MPLGTQFVAFDKDGFPLGVGRFKIQSDLIPGTFNIRNGFVTVSYACKSHIEQNEFEILCDGNIAWIESENGETKPRSVIGGRANNWENLYIGKVVRDGRTIIGKVHRSHQCLYIPWGEAEYKVQGKYQQMTDNNCPQEPDRRHGKLNKYKVFKICIKAFIYIQITYLTSKTMPNTIPKMMKMITK